MEVPWVFRPNIAEVLIQLHYKTLRTIKAFEIPVGISDPEPKEKNGYWIAKTILYK